MVYILRHYNYSTYNFKNVMRFTHKVCDFMRFTHKLCAVVFIVYSHTRGDKVKP